MRKGFWSEQWYKYRRKKTVWGISFDFIFTALVIAMVFPTSRKVVSATIIRYSMFQPRETEDVIYVKNSDLNWYVEDLEGSRVEIKELRDKPLFINFWATWCPPCIAEMPSIQRLYDVYKDDVYFILASSEPAGTLKKFIEKKEYTFPVYVLRQNVPDIFASRSIPASFLISPEGKIIMKKQGAARWDGKKVKHLLDKMINN
ncbi:redoxin domain-containing protein [Carboxylicivirga sp. N1Y90]|uniref:TlpA family protein disulfide reductase n=1 Tax=Carboxylicivirga fragile TaxID=3417571 RepID=UPI003D34C3A3|nr:redoxin domain-containing protein [Marinilabiliaceae bacterium N1Y90]